ncbi:hypothetical protein L211DRAFT_850350 [Terfezia boudieri ATCC MYA-4762]|uniref:Uncharacterized protein n=1 Tax=Terfezia boudieri ATCC MYA-4762 TaxID=1051890 RepID=A0A3N4LNQ7_9PEZI|nr:hypothetical protein L211DRAFT_850350 [Terfezia boudieri ATCC MYA-4762]
MSQQPSKRKKFARRSDAHALPATWVVGSSRVNELQDQQRTEGSNTADSQPNEAQGQQRTKSPNIAVPIAVSSQPMTNIQPNINAHYVAPGPQVGSAPVSNDLNAQLQLVCPAWDPQIQHIMDMGFRQGFLQLDKLSMPAAPNVMQDIPQICINKVRFLLQDFNASLGTTRRLVAETFRVFASPLGQQPFCPAPGANLAYLAIYQDFRLCALVLNILHETETALTNYCSNPSARLCRTLLLRYASTFIAAEYVLSWYHVFRTDGVDRFDMQLYLNRVTKLLCARLALVPALFQQRRWLEVFPPQGPGMEVEMTAGAAWDLGMATRLDLLKLLAEYSVYSVNNYSCGYLVSLMEAGNPASEMFHQWSFRG